MRRTGRRGRRGPRRLAWLAALAGAAAAAWLAGLVVFVEALPRAAPPNGMRTDGVVVLTGGTQRIEAGVAVLQAGGARRMLISGVNPASGKALLAHADPQMRTWLECCTDLGFVAVDTAGNAIEVAEWARRHGQRSLRVVTASFHMPRSLHEIGGQLPDVQLLAHPVFPPLVRLEQWWFSPGTAYLLAREYTKYLAVLLRSRIEAWLGPSFDRWLDDAP